ncbi:MAG: DUF116 domain-containing protein [candidate division Zixibacteria bacterium]|nr:DUF116 domain-containing protein [candidate division Zixibacteria bacterium]
MAHQGPTYQLGPDFYKKLAAFADRFTAHGAEYFADEFARMDEFLDRARRESPDRDAHLLRQTPREKYLLELVSFILYDEMNREKFNRAKNTLIILPDCLSLHNPDCLKTDEPWGDVCRQCVPDCLASRTVDLADRYGIDVLFSKRKLTEQLEHYREQSGDLAVIGIACVLMLAEGMRSAADAGVPARGVLLNFCGCEHWNDQPFASEFAFERLEALLKEKYGERD